MLKMNAQLDELKTYKEVLSSEDNQGKTFQQVMNEQLENHVNTIEQLNQYINNKCSMQMLQNVENNLA